MDEDEPSSLELLVSSRPSHSLLVNRLDSKVDLVLLVLLVAVERPLLVVEILLDGNAVSFHFLLGSRVRESRADENSDVRLNTVQADGWMGRHLGEGKRSSLDGRVVVGCGGIR